MMDLLTSRSCLLPSDILHRWMKQALHCLLLWTPLLKALGGLTLSSKSPAVSAGRLYLRLGAVLLQSTISSTPPGSARHLLVFLTHISEQDHLRTIASGLLAAL